VTSRTYPMICYISPFYLYLWAGFLMEVLMYKIFIVYFYQIDCYLCTIFFFTSLGIEADIFFPVRWLYEMTWFCWWQKWLTFCRACNSLTILCIQAFTLIWHHCLHYLFFLKLLRKEISEVKAIIDDVDDSLLLKLCTFFSFWH